MVYHISMMVSIFPKLLLTCFIALTIFIGMMGLYNSITIRSFNSRNQRIIDGGEISSKTELITISDLIDGDTVNIKACDNISEPMDNVRSLLNLYRDCSLGDSDLDLHMDLTWWTPDNSLLLNEALIEAGFTRLQTFGKLGEAGYEESYTKTEIKVDLFSATCTRFENKSSCSTGLWFNGEYHECILPMESIRRFSWWGGISVNLPYPVRDSLVAEYQKNFLHRFSDWIPHIHPFLTGFCLYN